MLAIKRDIVIECGSRWFSPVVLKHQSGAVYDLSGATARMQIRDMDGELLVDLSTANGGLTIDVAAGRIDRVIGAQATAAVSAERGIYDMEIIPGGNPDYAWKLYRGRVKFIGEQTLG